MSRVEMHERLQRLYKHLHICCYALYDSMNRFGDTNGFLDKCRAYDRAIEYLWKRLG